jgi:hypothetical protein
MEYNANLLIVGAPKCGTTSVADWLLQHDEIVLDGVEKELFYLMDKDDLLVNFGRSSAPNKASGTYRLDGTVHYLYQRAALTYYLKNEDVKAVVVLRDPVERLKSAYKFVKYSHSSVKKNYSFEQYVTDLLDGNIRNVEANYLGVHKKTAFKELEFGLYSKYIPLWKKKSGRLFLIAFDDMKNRPDEVMHELFQWLSLSKNETKFEVKNESYVPKSALVNKFSKLLARKFPFLRELDYLRALYANVNSSRVKPDVELSQVTQERLVEFYLEDIKFLENLRLGCDE